MEKVNYQSTDFDSFHEATCAALFDLYRWSWERPTRAIAEWRPDFLLRGNVSVFVECKGGLKWENVRDSDVLARLEYAARKSSTEVLLIPSTPRRVDNPRGYPSSVLGILFDGNIWSYAELGRWSGNVGFCHSADSWKDRISGEDVKMSSGDGQQPDVEKDWQTAESMVRGKRVSFFKGFFGSDVEKWEPSSRE